MDHATDMPQLKLVGEIELKLCLRCMGRGHIPCQQTVAVRTLGFNGVAALQPSTGHPIPCPKCLGKKVTTEIMMTPKFYKAEEFHQNFRINNGGQCVILD